MELEKTQTLETGFNNKKGFTLIELLITLVIIGIMSSMVFINFSTLSSVEARGKSFQKTFDYLAEESITTGNIIGWYANNDSESAYFISIDGLKMMDSFIEMPPSGFQDLLNYEKIFKSFDGNIYEIDDESNKQSPLIIFYPSGENSGGSLKIKRQDFVQIIHIGKNGVIEIEKAEY